MTLIQIGRSTKSSATDSAIDFHLVPGTELLFVVKGSRLYSLVDTGRSSLAEQVNGLQGKTPRIGVLDSPPALSLNIAQTCNLACRYCYADEGKFGGEVKLMPLEMAQEAIRVHISRAVQQHVSVGFIGGEPLLNRCVLHGATQFAVREAARNSIGISFGLTTNATLLQPLDLELLRSLPFAVNVSLDGAKEINDYLRPARNDRSSFDAVLDRIQPLLAHPGRSRLAARVTLTRRNLNVPEHIRSLANVGFAEVGVSPMRTGPDPSLRIGKADWIELLAQMKAAATEDWSRVQNSGGILQFSNFSTALRQLYYGACNALPCGSAATYVSLAADGLYYTCHRTVGKSEFQLGSIQDGLSVDLRRTFSEDRAVDLQDPCRSCWARYLCGGGCHAEVADVGREGCDAIRGWLDFCMSIYPEVLARRPDLLKNQ